MSIPRLRCLSAFVSRLVLAFALLGGAAPRGSSQTARPAQAPPSTFPSQVEQVTVGSSAAEGEDEDD